MYRLRSIALASLLASGTALGATTAETHRLHVKGEAQYRCYAGYDGKEVKDERTGEKCDNSTARKVLIEKVVSVTIRDEADPENSGELAGDWREEVAFKGRKFQIWLSLSKDGKPAVYKLRAGAGDDEPVTRMTSSTIAMNSMTAMNTLVVQTDSRGKKEEISFTATVRKP